MTSQPGTDSDMLLVRLNEYLATKETGAVARALVPLKFGWESRVYAVEVDGSPVSSQVLRLYYGADGGMTALREFRALALLHEASYPVPKPLLAEPSARPLGSPFLMMERVAGISHRSSVFNGRDESDRIFVAQFCELLARLHTLDWQRGGEAVRIETMTLDDQLRGWASIAHRFPSETAHPAFTWLVSSRTHLTEVPLAPVHWDFHHENVLVDDTGRATVIDWTQFQLTDARFDLAWTMTLLGSYAGDSAAEAIRDGYIQALPPGHVLRALPGLDWFEAAACAKRLLSVTIAFKHGAAALGMRPGAEETIAQGFGALAYVYRRWLALTDVPLLDVAELLSEHL